MKYRKKPVVIEAWQYTNDPSPAPAWVGHAFRDGELMKFGNELTVFTLEDGANKTAKHVASLNDWIIRGVKGELYACKPDIFAMTYDPA